ncbi:hypothetical protein PMAYCL1PPCAC_06108, partial [Pristionchus mayeri]
TQLCASFAENEDALPVYLRGIGWRNVEAELRQDLRLSPYIRPTSYELRLNVSVSGYGGAKKSRFDGNVRIFVDISAPVREIELHSQGLTIREATLHGLEFKAASPTEEEWVELNNGK